jgi:uncharacterized protein with HEPN domain
MKNKVGDKERLNHIIECINFIQKSLIGETQESFEKNYILHTAVVKWEEIIGEASYHLTTGLKEKHTEVDWKRIQGMRHVLVHEYFGIDIIAVWKVASESLDDLKMKIEYITRTLEP